MQKEIRMTGFPRPNQIMTCDYCKKLRPYSHTLFKQDSLRVFMKLIYLFVMMLSLNLHAQTAPLKIATYNMQGWVGSANSRFERLSELFKSQDLMQNVSVLMVQESMEEIPRSSAAQLADAMGWKSFSERRTSDNEGLGFIYSPKTQIKGIEVYQVIAKHSVSDYSRMALSMQINDASFGVVRLINTHLAHASNMGNTRKLQLKEIIDWVSVLENKNPSDLLIFGGDFNTDPAVPYYADEFSVLTKSKFAFKHIKSTGSSYTWIDKSNRQQGLIDHFFVSQENKNIRSEKIRGRIYKQTTDQNYSDHNLVMLNFEPNKTLTEH
jgi:endonuclease/exonuclease/phosphatase family metal-dependent hydrolase